MAGWSMLADGSALDCVKTPEKKLKQNDFWVDLKPGSNGSDIQLDSDKLRCEFEGFLQRFGKEICGRDCVRPLPPMLGDGQRVDLLKLLFAVRENGGYNVVSEEGLWDLVALESGLLGPNLGSTLKLIYIKYLDLLERWLKRVFDDKEHLMEFQDQIKDFLAKVPDQKKKRKDEDYLNLELEFKEVKSCADGEGLLALDSKKNVEKISDGKKGVIVLDGDVNGVGHEDEKKVRIDLSECVVNLQDNGKLFDNDEIEGVVMRLDGGSKCDDVVILDATNEEEESFCRKRKRESLCGLLNWVVGVAKDPCDPAVGSVPEWSVWKSHGKEEMWKQVLLAREAIFLKRQVESSADQWQKTQKMHPCMYDDQHGSNYNLRERFKCRKKLLSEKTMSQGRACSESSSASQSELDKNPCTEGMEDGLDKHFPGTSDMSTADSAIDKYASALEKYVPKRIPYGPRFEANVPEWTGVASESDPKWLGTRVWPLEKGEHRYLIERDPIGKGRQDSCGCEVPGSIGCVKFHIAEKRLRVKLELGSAFYRWKFDRMGEEVKISWTAEEEKKFEAILRSTPPPLQKCFWDQIFKIFPTKSRADLVSYYFNVYLLQRRGYQNRVTPNNIDSDDEEESGLVTNGNGHEADKSPYSILYSPKKPYANFR